MALGDFCGKSGPGKFIRKASLFAGGRKTLRLGTAGLRPQARAQGGVAPLLRNGQIGPLQKLGPQNQIDSYTNKPIRKYSISLLAEYTQFKYIHRGIC